MSGITNKEALKDNPRAKMLFIDNAQHGEHFIHYDQVILQFYDKHL